MKRLKDRLLNGFAQTERDLGSSESIAALGHHCYTPVSSPDVIIKTKSSSSLPVEKIQNTNSGSFNSNSNASSKIAAGKKTAVVQHVANREQKLLYCSLNKSNSFQTEGEINQYERLENYCQNSSATKEKIRRKNDSRSNSSLSPQQRRFSQKSVSRELMSPVEGQDERNSGKPVRATVHRYSTFDSANLGSQDFLSHAVGSLNEKKLRNSPSSGNFSENKQNVADKQQKDFRKKSAFVKVSSNLHISDGPKIETKEGLRNEVNKQSVKGSDFTLQTSPLSEKTVKKEVGVICSTSSAASSPEATQYEKAGSRVEKMISGTKGGNRQSYSVGVKGGEFISHCSPRNATNYAGNFEVKISPSVGVCDFNSVQPDRRNKNSDHSIFGGEGNINHVATTAVAFSKEKTEDKRNDLSRIKIEKTQHSENARRPTHLNVSGIRNKEENVANSNVYNDGSSFHTANGAYCSNGIAESRREPLHTHIDSHNSHRQQQCKNISAIACNASSGKENHTNLVCKPTIVAAGTIAKERQSSVNGDYTTKSHLVTTSSSQNSPNSDPKSDTEIKTTSSRDKAEPRSVLTRNWSFRAASRSAESQTDLSLVEPKFKDASTNTEITLVPPACNQQKRPSKEPVYQAIHIADFSHKDSQKPSHAAAQLADAVDKLAHLYNPLQDQIYKPASRISSYPKLPQVSKTGGRSQFQSRSPPRRNWSSRHYLKDRPVSFNETLHCRVGNIDPTLGRKGSRIYSSTNQSRLVTPTTSRYALSSRVNSSERFLDIKYGEIEHLLEKSPNFEDLADSENTFNVSQNFYSASEGSLLDDDSAIPGRQNTRRAQQRVTRLKDQGSSSAEPNNRGENLNARFFPNNKFYQNRARSNSNEGLLRQVSSAQSRIRSTKTGHGGRFGSGHELNDHKVHRSACNLIDSSDCRTNPGLGHESRTRTVGSIWNPDNKMSYHEFNGDQLPKSKSTSGSIFLKQVVEPSKAFAYLTSIDTLADATDGHESTDRLSSLGKPQDKLYEPLCQNCGLKGHSILKCDRISRVDKLYDVIMLGDRVTITHNEPNYVRSQRNKLPRCYHCGLKGHRSRSCSKLAPQATAEEDPFESGETTFNAFTIPRSTRRARSEARPTPELQIPAPDYSVSNNSMLLSPVSTDTILSFRNAGQQNRQYLDSKQSDVFCSDVDYGYDSAGAFMRPISMYDTLPNSRSHHNTSNGGLISERRPIETTKKAGVRLKLKATESSPHMQMSPKDQFQKRNTLDFDDRDSGIGYGDSSSQTNLENFPRTPISNFGHNERPVDALYHPSETSIKPTANGSPGTDSEPSDKSTSAKKSAKPKKKNPILLKIACMTGNKSSAH